MIVTASFMVFPIAMAIGVLGLDARASLYPMVLSAVLIIFLIFILWSQLRSLQSTRIGTPLPDKVLMRDVFSQDGALWPQLLEFSNLVIFMMLIVIFGFPIATVLFVICFIVHREPTRFVIASLLGFTLVGLMWLLSNLLTLQYPAGWIVNFVNLPWWL